MEAQPKEIQRYSTPDGTVPFDDWLDSLRDLKGKAKIVKRLQRVSNGNLGDCRSLGEGIFELRIDFDRTKARSSSFGQFRRQQICRGRSLRIKN
jgi:hypothetical protein